MPDSLLTGIMGGAFDPVHDGHLRMALALCQQMSLAEVRFVPVHTAVHKIQPLATPQDRLAMLKLAIADQPDFMADDREIRRAGNSYMIDTLESLQTEFPARQFALILGSDALAGFPQWHRFEEILALVTKLVVVPRAQHHPAETTLPQLLREKIHWQPVAPLLAVSSSFIRKELKAGRSVRYLLPDAVWRYIQQQQIYL